MEPEVVAQLELSPADADVQRVIDGLSAFNGRKGPPGPFRRFAVFVRHADGRIGAARSGP